MLSKPNQIAVERARRMMSDHPGYYARTLAAIQRAGSFQQQRAIDAVIAEDNTDHLFVRENGCLIAAPGI